MQQFNGDQPESLDHHVHGAFKAWDDCHCTVRDLRAPFDRALRHHEQEGGPEPTDLRTQLRAAQDECDQLFFRFLRAAEDRTRARYI